MPHVYTYRVHLCENGEEFEIIGNVAASVPWPRADVIIDDKWKVIGILKQSTAKDIFVDVEEVPTSPPS